MIVKFAVAVAISWCCIQPVAAQTADPASQTITATMFDCQNGICYSKPLPWDQSNTVVVSNGLNPPPTDPRLLLKWRWEQIAEDRRGHEHTLLDFARNPGMFDGQAAVKSIKAEDAQMDLLEKAIAKLMDKPK